MVQKKHVILSAHDTKFFIMLLERAFKMIKNGFYFIVIAELFQPRSQGLSSLPLLVVGTPRKITLFKHKSWTEQRVRCRQKCRYFEDICLSFRGGMQVNSKRGVVTNDKSRKDLQPPTSTTKNQQPPQKHLGPPTNNRIPS